MTQYTLVECDVARATERAILIHYYDDNEKLEVKEKWIPRSAVEDGDSIERGEEQELHIATWLCEKEGIPLD